MSFIPPGGEGTAPTQSKSVSLADLLVSKQHALSFNILDIGALPLEGLIEPVHALLDQFPSSRISALEIDPALCEKLNREARPGIRYYPCALGRREEKRFLYETAHSMCTSLYEPDERYIAAFNNLDDQRLVRRSEVETVSLDTFVRTHDIGALDFIKMDIQGAELDVLKGGDATLPSVLAVVCEVEFVPLYKGQPLYGDIDAHLRSRGFMLHTFVGFAGRVMKPLAFHGTPNYPIQMMWSDALFTRDLFEFGGLTGEQILKLAVLLDLYDSKDVALHLLRHYDRLHSSGLGDDYMRLLLASGVWTEARAPKTA
jgi:FkbM family methyltransferase